jgi:hypothetical protein
MPMLDGQKFVELLFYKHLASSQIIVYILIHYYNSSVYMFKDARFPRAVHTSISKAKVTVDEWNSLMYSRVE